MLALFLTLAIAVLGALPLPAQKPNIVFIMVDDLGPEWISSYGGEGIETPNVDELARRGMSFENAYSMPQCTPTRATLLTGQYPFRHGWVNHWDVPRWGAGCHFDPKYNVTFARQLEKAGYKTAVAGKWQINDFRVQPEVLRKHGFQEWSMWTGFESLNPPSAERYWNPYVFSNLHPSKTYTDRFGPDVFNEFVLDFLARHRSEPMLVYYPMALTHTPLVATPHEPFAESNYDRHRAMVRYMDYLVGRVMKQLVDLGLWENTYLFFTTDNGTAQSIDGRLKGRAVPGGKATLTENGMREPFIVSGPGIEAGSRTTALTDFSDMMPTFVELAGAELPEGVVIDGKSVAGVLRGSDRDGPREWILAMGHGPARLDEKGVRPVKDFADRVVRDKRYKLHVLDGMAARLHDLLEDPGETVNLIGSDKPEHLAARRKLTAVVESFPKTDARPRYDPLPAQRWDMTREKNEGMWRQQ